MYEYIFRIVLEMKLLEDFNNYRWVFYFWNLKFISIIYLLICNYFKDLEDDMVDYFCFLSVRYI